MKSISSALLNVQRNLDPVHKGRKGYGYNYADLPAVMDSCLDALNAAGILVVQAPTVTDKQAAAIFTRLIHAESGEELTSTIEVPWAIGGTKMSEAQAYGSAMTYARRYALVSMLGIVTEDDDGAAAGRREAPKANPVAPKPVEPTPDEKATKALHWAKSAVMVASNFMENPRALQDYIAENRDHIEAASKYADAKEVLIKGGLVEV